jgi:two-component system cell cycle sensor histidine kinase/response regulator CckA
MSGTVHVTRREGQELFPRLLEAAGRVALVCRADGEIVFLNRTGRRVLGAGGPDAPGWLWRFMAPPAAEQFRKRMATVLAGGGEWQGTSVLRARDGTEIPVSLTLVAGPGEAGGAAHFGLVAEDQRAATVHRDNERLLERAQELARIGSWWYDLSQDGALRWSKQTYEIFGVSEREFDGHIDTFWNLVHPDDREAVRSACRAALDGRGAYSVEHRIIRADGRIAWVHEEADVIRDAAGCPAQMIGVSQDITERRQAEDALRLSEARYRTLFELAPEAILTLDVRHWELVEANASAERLLGYPRETLLRLPPDTFSPPAQPDGANSAAAIRERLAAADAAASAFEWVFRNSAGGDVPCEVRLAPLPSESSQLVRLTITDISHRKRLEEQLRVAQRMESVGRLAGGIAHDFNNVLTAVLGFVELARRPLPAEHPVQDHLSAIQEAAERAANLTRQLLAFSRKQVNEPKIINLADHLHEMDRLLRRLLGEDVDLRIVPAADLWSTRIDPSHFQQVIVNLAVNARDAMPDGGSLVIQTRNISRGDKLFERHPSVPPGDYVLVTVTDTGAGIDPAIQPHIFEPFFSTKGLGQGTGLGLPTCMGNVQRADGHISVESAPGKGATFLVWLPRHGGSADVAARAPAALAGGSETILLVEDEASVRRIAASVLESLGYSVISAESGPEALGLVDSHSGPIDLLVTDVIMPQLSGKALADQLAKRLPGLPVLYTSGYDDNVVARHGALDPGVNFLQKPYTPAVLGNKVRELLDRRAHR